MSNLNDSSLTLLTNNFYFPRLKKVKQLASFDGTVKYLYQLADGNLIETVIMRHNYGNSICITTQVGCNMGCKFCASGVIKKVRNLTAGEMLSQIIESQKYFKDRISHVVVMGIGEPFDNYDNLISFLTNVNDYRALEIGARHITVSACGFS